MEMAVKTERERERERERGSSNPKVNLETCIGATGGLSARR